jgi:hypothetical protein
MTGEESGNSMRSGYCSGVVLWPLVDESVMLEH